MHRCLNCGKPITYTFAICSGCEKKFGNSSREWPDWLRYLWAQTQRERRAHKNINEYEIDMDLEYE